MPRTQKAASSSRKTTAKRGSSKNTKTRRVKSHAKRSTATRRVASRKSSGHRTANGATYVFECTRQGCGYRIVREENAEVGQLRSDLKCPKCHNSEFKCLGKGDLPETLELAIPATTIDFDSIRPVDLGRTRLTSLCLGSASELLQLSHTPSASLGHAIKLLQLTIRCFQFGLAH